MTPRELFLLLGCATAGWSGSSVLTALRRWLAEQSCRWRCPPFVDIEWAAELRRAHDWQSPLTLAALPLLAWAACWLLRRAIARWQHGRALIFPR